MKNEHPDGRSRTSWLPICFVVAALLGMAALKEVAKEQAADFVSGGKHRMVGMSFWRSINNGPEFVDLRYSSNGTLRAVFLPASEWANQRPPAWVGGQAREVQASYGGLHVEVR